MVFFSLTLIILQGMNPVLASAIVPGWGEWILKKKNEARTFFIIEGTLWISYYSFNYFGHKLEKSSRIFAFEHAGANPLRSDMEYFDNLEDYNSSDEYNLLVERDASWYYPDDPVKQQEYIKENGYFGEDAWEWDTLANRNFYWQRRKSARENLRRASFMTGFMIINRIVSVINVAVFKEEKGFGLETGPGKLGIHYKF
ncbi:MAG: hypothetical protein N3A65_08395 [candidate division WOR-3 bacterium]|nr:hypothetical protein [candidate division WOR-3 bacterium]